MKKLPLLLFAVTVLAQWAAPLLQIWKHERTLAQGSVHRLKCTAPDPYDPLRGRYLAVRPEQEESHVDKGLKLVSGQRVYVTLLDGPDGLARLSSAHLTPPESGAYVRMSVRWAAAEGLVRLEWPFDRFYLNEKLAPEADKWFAESIRSSKGVVAEIRVLKGSAVLTDLVFDGRSFREILKERVK